MMFSFSFVGGSKSAEGGPNPLADLDRGGPNLGGSKSAGTQGKGKKCYVWMKEHFRTITMFWHLNDFFVSFHDSNVSYDFSFFCYTQ